MLHALSRWWQDRQRLRLRASLVCPRRTGRVALLLAVAVIALIMLALLIGIAYAEPQTMYVCTEVDPLNVRDSPSLHAPWVYRLDRGEAVTVHEVKGKWAYVERCGDYGWAWSAYLADKPPADGLPEGWLDVEPEPDTR